MKYLATTAFILGNFALIQPLQANWDRPLGHKCNHAGYGTQAWIDCRTSRGLSVSENDEEIDELNQFAHREGGADGGGEPRWRRLQ